MMTHAEMKTPIPRARILPEKRHPRLKLANDIAQFNAQRFGDFQECINGDGSLRSLNLADVNRVQVGFLGQLFLAQMSFLSAFTDVVTDQFPVFWIVGHNPLKKQGTATRCHKRIGLVLLLRFPCPAPKTLALRLLGKCDKTNETLTSSWSSGNSALQSQTEVT